MDEVVPPTDAARARLVDIKSNISRIASFGLIEEKTAICVSKQLVAADGFAPTCNGEGARGTGRRGLVAPSPTPLASAHQHL